MRLKKQVTSRNKKQSKKQNKVIRWISSHTVVTAILSIAIFGGIGAYIITASQAATVSNVRVSTSLGCRLVGRVWDGDSCNYGAVGSSAPCISKAETYREITGTDKNTRGYCTNSVALSIGQSSCVDTLHRMYVYQIGCARRIDQNNTANAVQCQPDYPNYVANVSTDYCKKPTTTTTTTGIDTTNKDAVNNAYKSLWVSGQSVTSGWTGSVNGCKAGTITAAAQTAHVNAVNFVRRMVGLGSISASTNTAGVQSAALMMEANGSLSHSPPTTWICYTDAGKSAAGKSDIALAFPTINPVKSVDLYMKDPGDSNQAAGHRRWILNPPTSSMAFGMTTAASAIQVIGLSQDNTANPAWVQWPSDGYFPDAIEPNGRWSLSSGNNTASFTNATVTVTHNGTNVPVTKFAPHTGYAKPTLVWQMPAGFAKTGTYTVSVKNVVIGSTAYSSSYNVTFFTPY